MTDFREDERHWVDTGSRASTDERISWVLKSVAPPDDAVDRAVERAMSARSCRWAKDGGKSRGVRFGFRFAPIATVCILAVILAVPASSFVFKNPIYALDFAKANAISVEELSFAGTVQSEDGANAVYRLSIVWSGDSVEYVEYRSTSRSVFLAHAGDNTQGVKASDRSAFVYNAKRTAYEEELIHVEGQDAIELTISVPLGRTADQCELSEVEALGKSMLEGRGIQATAHFEDGSVQEKTCQFY